jgi:hypothetical protein
MDNFNFNFTPPQARAQQPGQPFPQPQKDQSKKPAAGPSPELLALMDEMNSTMRRLRMLEERNSNLQRRDQMTDQNMLSNQKKVAAEIKALTSEFTEMKTELAKLKDTLSLVIQDLKECAKKDELAVLDKYLKLWEPVKFVTQNQVERIVKELMDGYQQKQAPQQSPLNVRPADKSK